MVLLLCAPMAGGSVEQTVAAARHRGDPHPRRTTRRWARTSSALLLDVLRAHRLAMPPSLLLVFRTLASLEGTLRKLVPGYDMVGRALEVAPHIARTLASAAGPSLLGLQTQSAIVAEQLRRLPRRIEGITRSLRGRHLRCACVRSRAPTSAAGWTAIVGGRHGDGRRHRAGRHRHRAGRVRWRTDADRQRAGVLVPGQRARSRRHAAAAAEPQRSLPATRSGTLTPADSILPRPRPRLRRRLALRAWSTIDISATAVSRSRRSRTATG